MAPFTSSPMTFAKARSFTFPLMPLSRILSCVFLCVTLTTPSLLPGVTMAYARSCDDEDEAVDEGTGGGGCHKLPGVIGVLPPEVDQVLQLEVGRAAVVVSATEGHHIHLTKGKRDRDKGPDQGQEEVLPLSPGGESCGEPH